MAYHCFFNAVENAHHKANEYGQHEPLEMPARVWVSADAARWSGPLGPDSVKRLI